MQQVIDTLTGWMPGWLQSVTEILIYLGILGALSAAPLIGWLLWVTVIRPPRPER